MLFSSAAPWSHQPDTIKAELIEEDGAVLKDARPGIGTGAHYRTVGEAQIVDMLLVAAFVYELQAGQRSSATAAVRSALKAWVGLGLGSRACGYRRANLRSRRGRQLHEVGRLQGPGPLLGRSFRQHRKSFLPGMECSPGSGAVADCTSGTRTLYCGPAPKFRPQPIRSWPEAAPALALPFSCCSDDIEVSPVISYKLSARLTRSGRTPDFQLAAPDQPMVEVAARISFTTDGRSRTTSKEPCPLIKPSFTFVQAKD